MPKDLNLILCLLGLWLAGLGFFNLQDPTSEVMGNVLDQRLRDIHSSMRTQEPLQIAFFGSSKTMNGIHAQQLSEDFGQVMNYGSNWHGVDLSCGLARTCAQLQQPKLIVIEIGFLRRYFMHQNTKRAIPMQDLLTMPWHSKTPENLIYAFPRHLNQYGAHHAGIRPLGSPLEDRGTVFVDQNAKQKTGQLQYFQNELSQQGPLPVEKIEPQSDWRQQLAKLRLGPQRHQIRSLRLKLEKNGIRVVLLALPKFRMSRMSEDWKNYWSEAAPLILLEPDLLDQAQFWRDESHLNEEGAKFLAKALIPYLKKHLK